MLEVKWVRATRYKKEKYKERQRNMVKRRDIEVGKGMRNNTIDPGYLGQETDQRCKDTKKKATREYERTPTHEKEYNDRRIYQ